MTSPKGGRPPIPTSLSEATESKAVVGVVSDATASNRGLIRALRRLKFDEEGFLAGKAKAEDPPEVHLLFHFCDAIRRARAKENLTVEQKLLDSWSKMLFQIRRATNDQVTQIVRMCTDLEKMKAFLPDNKLGETMATAKLSDEELAQWVSPEDVRSDEDDALQG